MLLFINSVLGIVGVVGAPFPTPGLFCRSAETFQLKPTVNSKRELSFDIIFKNT